MTRKRSAETDAERLEEETDKRIALKRKARMIPVTRKWKILSWIRLRDCGIGKMIQTMKLICSSFKNVIATLRACMRPAVISRCVKSPRHLSHTMNAVWITFSTRVAKLLNNTLVEKARARISVIREVGVWEVVDRPRDEVVFGTRWVDINKGDEH